MPNGDGDCAFPEEHRCLRHSAMVLVALLIEYFSMVHDCRDTNK